MYVPQKLVSNHSRLFRWKFLIGSALLCFPLAYCIVQISILKLLDSLRRLDLQMWCWIFSLWFSMMSPINNVLLCFARASYFVQVSVMKMFKSSIEYSLQNSVSIHSLLFRWKSPISAALLCFSLASYIVQVSILKLFLSFGRLHLQMWCWIFSLWFLMMSSINIVLLCFGAPFLVEVSVMKKFKASVEYVCSAKVSFKSFTIVPMEVSDRLSAALLSAGLLYCSNLNIETLR